VPFELSINKNKGAIHRMLHILMKSNLEKYAPLILSLSLILIILIIFYPVSGFEFLNYDDDIYVTDNIRVRGGLQWENVQWAFITIEAGFWHPLTWLSLMLDHEIFRLNAGGYHWTNVLFHIANTLLLFYVLRRMTGTLWRSGCVAALFAIHPLHVESVAWIAARKDVLSTLFWMLAMWAYVAYAERPRAWRYFGVLLFYCIGLMSKPMVVTLPVVLLLMDYWPLRRFDVVSTKRLIVEKVPLILLTLPVIWITFAAEKKIGALGSLNAFPWDLRLSNALVSYVLYLWKTIYPISLSVYYPHVGQWSLWATLSALGLLVGITVLAICWRKRHPYLIVGWLWYLTTLLPVIGIVQIGSHAMADRYTYVPLVGIFLMLVWVGVAVTNKFQISAKSYAFAILLIMAPLAALSINQLSYWQNGVTLTRHVLDVIGDNIGTYNNLGNALARKGFLDDAIVNYKAALRIDPNYTDGMVNLGNVLLRKRQMVAAIEKYERALELAPGFTKARFNLAIAYAASGDDGKAIRHYLEIIHTQPNLAEAYNNLAIIYVRKGHLKEAATLFKKALEIKPGYEDAGVNLNIVNRQMNVSESVN